MKLNNLELCHPELVSEWDPTNEKPMNEYTRGSGTIVKWICKSNPCGCHKWCSCIKNRTTSQARGCPYCSNHKLCPHNNLKAMHPELEKEWHHSNPPMESFFPCTRTKVKWTCSHASCFCHIWDSTINSRTATTKTGCPYCANLKLCIHNNLKALHPQLISEWHPNNKNMELYPPNSGKIVQWICKKNNDHIWDAVIYHRTKIVKPSGCPHCAKGRSYSNVQMLWLDQIEINEGIIIQHALKPEGEYKIDGVGRVDGFCTETNTVYEFHGDFWHGNPKIYDPNDINPVKKKKYGDLYNKTIKRDALIKNLGYNLITKWESD